jgi:hypothetical protein
MAPADDASAGAIPGVRPMAAPAPFGWPASGWRDFRAHPLPSA